MSIKTFNAFHQHGTVYLQTPLTHINDLRHGKYVGWTTQVSMPERGVPRLTVLRTTTFCGVGKNGPRRLIRGHPTTQETLIVGPFSGVTLRAVTRWVVREKLVRGERRRYRSIINDGFVDRREHGEATGYDFNQITAFRDAFMKERLGQPFIDYLMEETPLGEYLSGPGRLPYDWVEMRKWEWEAAEARKPADDVNVDDGEDGEDTDEGEDRWR